MEVVATQDRLTFRVIGGIFDLVRPLHLCLRPPLPLPMPQPVRRPPAPPLLTHPCSLSCPPTPALMAPAVHSRGPAPPGCHAPAHRRGGPPRVAAVLGPRLPPEPVRASVAAGGWLLLLLCWLGGLKAALGRANRVHACLPLCTAHPNLTCFGWCSEGYASLEEVQDVAANYSAAGLPLEALWTGAEMREWPPQPGRAVGVRVLHKRADPRMLLSSMLLGCVS